VIMRNQKLTDVIQERRVISSLSARGIFTLGFEDASHLSVETRGVSEWDPIGATVQAVRQEGTELMLDFADGRTLEIEFAEATSRVLVRTHNGGLEYAGGSDPESWGVVLENEGETQPETPETAWRISFQGTMHPVEAWIVYLLDPSLLQVRAHRHQKPRVDNWLSSLLKHLRAAHHILRMGRELGATTEKEAQRFQRAQELAQRGAREHLAWVKERMQHEFADLVGRYSGRWIKAVEAVISPEFGLVLMQRDQIEAHLRAPEWLHPDLSPDPRLVQLVEEMDAVLRKEGPRLWALDPATMEDAEHRASRHPREDWWWWLDQGGSEGTAAS
jgi:hypothetical protein